MLKGAVDHVGNGLEPSVRMPRGPLRLTGPVLHLAHLVHMDERIQVSLIEPIERTPHRKALALYAFWSRSDGEDGPFHRCDRIDVREARQAQDVVDRDGGHLTCSNRAGTAAIRSEERRVGKECRSWSVAEQLART